MIADLMPAWFYRLLNMDNAILPTDVWTWRHFCRYGTDPAEVMHGYNHYMRQRKRTHT